MPKYNFYSELRENFGTILRRTSGFSKKKMRRLGADPVSTALKMFFSDLGTASTIDAAVLMDEEDYIHQGRPVFVPSDRSLIEMLWRSKMSVDPEDLSGFPRCFSVAWPSGTVVDGVELPGCLVWFGRQAERVAVGQMLDKWTPVPYPPPTKEQMEAHPEWWCDGFGFHLSFSQGDSCEKRVYVRLSVPPETLIRCLGSEEELGSIGSSGLFCRDLEPDDIHQQYVVARCVVGLMVYATACPNAVAPGWPEGVGSSRSTKGRIPTTLMPPAQRDHQGGTHASPEAHLRSGCGAYFRSYPRRKDGSRKKGIYLVSGHGPVMVNAEVDPSTVRKVGK